MVDEWWKFWFIRKIVNSRESKQIAQVLRVIYTESSLESRQHGSRTLAVDLYSILPLGNFMTSSPQSWRTHCKPDSSMWSTAVYKQGLARMDTPSGLLDSLIQPGSPHMRLGLHLPLSLSFRAWEQEVGLSCSEILESSDTFTDGWRMAGSLFASEFLCNSLGSWNALVKMLKPQSYWLNSDHPLWRALLGLRTQLVFSTLLKSGFHLYL